MTSSGSGSLFQAHSRVIHLDMGQVRDHGANHGTAMVPLEYLRSVPFEALFLAHYPAIRSLARHAPGPGLVIAAVHRSSCGLAGRAWLAAPVGDIKAAILGRHSQCDLLLEDPALSLRHLAVIARVRGGWDAHNVAFSVLDLRTGTAFRDERGRALEGLSAEGPVFISVGNYALFMLQTGDRTDWPALATDALAMMPSRVYLDERGAEPDRWRRGAHMPRPAKGERTHTVITAIGGPLDAGDRLLADGEDASGTLRIARGGTERVLTVGPAALRRGLLLGRYPRCDIADLLRDPQLSRAHLLVTEIDGMVYGIDAASTAGCSRASDPLVPARVIALGRGEAVILGEHRAYVSYRPR